MRSPFGVDECVELVDDQRPGRFQHGPSIFGGQHEKQGLRGGDQNVGRMLDHPLTVLLGRVPGADSHLDLLLPLLPRDAEERPPQVLPDIPGQGFEGGNVDQIQLLFKLPRPCQGVQPVDKNQECGQGLSGSRRRADQSRFPGPNGGPGRLLHIRWLSECICKPLRRCG